MKIDQFNALDAAEAATALRPALDVPRWIDEIVASRPYGDVEHLLQAAHTAAQPLTTAEIDGALIHHPRIGDRAEGESTEAGMSRSEQSSIDPDDTELQRELRARNIAYEERFGRVFLIRAAGRTPGQILDALEERMHHTPEQELPIIAEQLRQIAALRLEGQFTA